MDAAFCGLHCIFRNLRGLTVVGFEWPGGEIGTKSKYKYVNGHQALISLRRFG